MNRNPHPVAPEEVMSYLDGELDQTRAAVVAEHLEECSECQALTGELRHVSHQMASWKIEAPPNRMDESVRAVLETQMKTKRKAPAVAAPVRRPFFQHWGWGLAAGLAIVLVVASVSIPNLLRSRMAVSRTAQSDRDKVQGDQLALNRREPARSFNLAAPPPEAAQVDEGTAAVPPGPMIVRTATLSILTREFDNGRAVMERTVNQLQGYVENLSLTAPNDAGQTLSATLRIPSDKLDTALVELRKLGRVEQESQSGEEVTRQYTDLVARLSNSRSTEQRLIQVLQQRTGKVADVLAVEREIARVRGEIERMDAQRKGLETQVSFATLQLSLREEHQSELGVAPPSTGIRLWNDLVAGYDGLVETAIGLLEFVLRSGPVLLFWFALLYWPARRLWRHLHPAV